MEKAKNIIIVTFITIILLEIALQLNYYIQNRALLFYRVNTQIYVKDQDYGHRVKPNLKYHHVTNEFNVMYYTNSKGLRCSRKMEEYNHPVNKYRIILNGPSFAFGWGVNYEQSFAAILENILKADYIFNKDGVQVIDFGVPCRAMPVQIRYLEKEGKNYKPSLVLQFAYGSMIVRKDDPNNYTDVKNGYLINKTAGYYWITSKIKQSGIVFYSWIAYNRLLPLIKGNNHDNKIIGAGRDLSNFTKFDIDSKEVMDSLKYYNELKLYCQLINAKLIIIYFPLSYCIHNEDVTRWKHLGVKDIQGEHAFNREFCDYLNKNGFDCVNMTDDLISAARVSHKRLYYWLDVHWTPYGNEVAAKLVSKYILEHQSFRYTN
jgi:hypothetical protein